MSGVGVTGQEAVTGKGHLAAMRGFAASLSDDLGPLFGRDVIALIDAVAALVAERDEWKSTAEMTVSPTLREQLAQAVAERDAAATRDVQLYRRIDELIAERNAANERTRIAEEEREIADGNAADFHRDCTQARIALAQAVAERDRITEAATKVLDYEHHPSRESLSKLRAALAVSA